MMSVRRLALISFTVLATLLALASAVTLMPRAIGDDFVPSQTLRALYVTNTRTKNGYSRTMINFKMRVPAINFDNFNDAIESAECDESAGRDSVSFTFSDPNYAENIKRWPGAVLGMFSHTWNCDGTGTTTFFMLRERRVDRTGRRVTFNATPVPDIKRYTETFSMELGPDREEGNQTDPEGSVFHERLLTLDFMYDKAKNASSQPMIPIATNDGKNGIFCENCYGAGELSFALRIEGAFRPWPVITFAMVELNGQYFVNMDFNFRNENDRPITTSDVKLFEIPLDSIGIPGILEIAPRIVVNAKASLSTGLSEPIRAGFAFDIPEFSYSVEFEEFKLPVINDEGLEPRFISHEPSLKGVASNARLTANLTPRLALNIGVMGGASSIETGFQLVTNARGDVRVGAGSGCAQSVPRFRATADGNFGVFAGKLAVPLVTFPREELINECIDA